MSASEASVRSAWSTLEQQLRWADPASFSIFYVFTPSPVQAKMLAAHVRSFVEHGILEAVCARIPDQLRTFARELQPLLEELSRPTPSFRRATIWIDGSFEFEAEDDSEWRRAWLELVARLNERREPMRASLRALFVVAPPKPRWRYARQGRIFGRRGPMRASYPAWYWTYRDQRACGHARATPRR